jgi:hypothetical protein
MAKLPPSPVARYFLRSLLDVIPVYTTLEPYRDLNMNVWRKKGAHSLISSDSSKFVLIVNQREYAANLMAEVQHLLNHAMEHRAHLVNSLSTGEDPSPAWTFVSLYYFSLFVAMAWTRIANKGIFYLDKEAVSEYCNSSQKFPGAGAFCASASRDPATLAYHITFKKCSRSHFHEAVWVCAANEAKEAADWIEKLSSGRRATTEELDSLKAMRLFGGSKFNDPQTWPSVLRNSLNYRPGFGYRSVPKHNNLKIRSRLVKSSWSNMSEVVSFGEKAKQALGNTKEPFESINDAVDLLIVQSVLLENFVEESVRHLCSLQDLACSAATQRAKFGRGYTQKLNTLLTPFA